MNHEQDQAVVHADEHANATHGIQANDADTSTTELVEIVDELLIEEISIDGMCGVY
jgi:mycofactocin precursor